ncbi:MAG: Si-specific NAD(P)(+) transhydrogenase [Acidobacteria bacterium]|nr:Si-specific NAD(P)(+) transhydrogenase [Acidobacteriota bacterium]MCA1609935.1 Si-specific NAD(P)(+) transhydrogenase [Acidobacteriota bacterium]
MSAFDLVVIGTGPAGQRAAIQAAKLGRKVAICERRTSVGGVCINTGTIPSKTFREAVLYLTGFLHRDAYGSACLSSDTMTMDALLSRCSKVIARETEVIRDQLRRNGVAVLSGAASFADPHRLMIDAPAGRTEVTAEFVVIATGTAPTEPPGVTVDGETVITSDGILTLKSIPRSMTVVGGGVVGTEYASMFAALGVEVTLVDRRPRLLEFVDAEIAEALAYKMRDMDCTLRLGEDVASVEVERPHRAVATLKSGKKIISELLLYSIGRIGATAELNLAAAGLATDSRGRIVVDEQYRTAVPHIFAAGDVIGFPALASTSMEQGRIAACAAFGIRAKTMPHLFPYGIYSVPEISMVGPNEEELTKAGVPYEIGISRYREIARGAILGDSYGLLKILFHRETRKFLAVHIIGSAATELVHIGQAVLAFEGTIDYFVDNVFNYPTFAECYKVAALDGYNKIGPPPGEAMPPGTTGRKADS